MSTEIVRTLAGHRFVTDGGLETDVIFHHGVDLPEFASFPLLDDAAGRRLLVDYYAGYADVAAAAGVGMLLEAPTWRASHDWGARLGYDDAALHRVNCAAIAFLAERRSVALATHGDRLGPVLTCGVVGPRGDGYQAASEVDADAAQAYHAPQLEAFAEAGADLATAYTMTTTEEAIGIVCAAHAVDLPVLLSFTVETDGRLPDRTLLADAIVAVDAAAPPEGFGVNCAHPRHILAGLDPSIPGWAERIVSTRVNASVLSHAELDEAAELHDGDPAELAIDQSILMGRLPSLSIVGGCCGTDVRHVAAMWDGSHLAGQVH